MTVKWTTLSLVLAIFSALPLFSWNARAQEQAESDLLSLSIGYFDAGDNQNALDARIEYRWGDPLVWVVKPWAGAEITSDGAIYGLGGLTADITLNGRWTLAPGIGGGLYMDGNGKDLGSVIAFRSQLEALYALDNGQRLGIAASHISNAGIGSKNPGTEVLSLYWHLPVSWF